MAAPASGMVALTAHAPARSLGPEARLHQRLMARTEQPCDEGGEFLCPHCGHTDDESAIAGNIDDVAITKNNYFDRITPANCACCERYHTIVPFKNSFLCVSCFSQTNGLEQCELCGEHSNGDMEGSYASGCSVCEGTIGWHGDRD